MGSRLMLISLNNDPSLEFGSAHIGGQAKYVLELSKHLLIHNWDIDIYTIGNCNQEEKNNFLYGVCIYRFFRKNKIAYNYDITIDEINEISDNILTHIKKNNIVYDIILACYWISGLCALNIKNSLPSVISFSSLGSFKQTIENNEYITNRIKYEKIIVEKIDKIIATSEVEKNELCNSYNADCNKISIIPRGIDPEVFFPK